MRARAIVVALVFVGALVALSCSRTDEPGERLYAPNINPEHFGAAVDNAFFPLVPGTVYSYSTPDSSEQIEVTVTEETRKVMGVECRVVESREFRKGKLVELSHDFYAQGGDASVWYFGEKTTEYAADGTTSTEGSWEAGVDGAQPGIIMPGLPVPGEAYREEYYKGHAEDMAQVEDVDGTVKVPYGTFDGVLVTKEWSDANPEDVSHKYYARTIGLVLEEEGTSRMELTRIVPGSGIAM
jgi:hypothetical protein